MKTSDNACIYIIGQDECEEQGLKKVLTKEYCDSMAQMILPTVCAPCGNGVCDAEIESECNCPEDC